VGLYVLCLFNYFYSRIQCVFGFVSAVVDATQLPVSGTGVHAHLVICQRAMVIIYSMLFIYGTSVQNIQWVYWGVLLKLDPCSTDVTYQVYSNMAFCSWEEIT